MTDSSDISAATGLEIAIVGMAARVPGASTIAQFWANLCNGVESITFFSDEELLQAGVDPTLLADPNYVKASGTLEQIDRFDAAFFGISPREASLLDPQQRLFLECAWEALEDAGYDPERHHGAIGVYAGVGTNGYRHTHPAMNRPFTGTAEDYQITLANDKDFLATRVSYKFNLTGPSVTIQTACSTSLVATHLACQSLISGESDLALAGGASIRVPHITGYLYQSGGVVSPEGRCRAFDAKAQGTVVGSGVGVVVLKRLEDALADRDSIYAVIKGTAINNDGTLKIGYNAPGLDGQARVIRAAHQVAEVDPATITYVETHGTGTALGDPLEIAALTQAFQAGTANIGFCAIGSVKTNIGHLDAAAGVIGLIKTALALKHRQIPPSLHFETPNPKIDFANSPFYVNTMLTDWPTNGLPRRAGVSSFGMGGTNAHAVLEEAPAAEPSARSRPWQLLVLSAQTPTALDTATANLRDYLREHPAAPLADVAYTYQVGRKAFNHRRMLVCRDREDALAALESVDPQRVISAEVDRTERPVVFLFPGQGAQYPRMAAGLYQTEPVFRDYIDCCAELLKPHLDLDLRIVLFPGKEQVEEGTGYLNQTAIAQPALFVVEYALAQVWMAWGIQPQIMLGHSVGEYVAACLAGVFSLQDALALVAIRGRLMQQLPPGSMLSIPLGEAEVQAYLHRVPCPEGARHGTRDLSVAAVNGPAHCVVSGSGEAIAHLERQLREHKVENRRLHTSHAFHSAMMTPMLESFFAKVSSVRLNPPRLAYISNLTGTWITAAEATDPRYWVRHARHTVRFGDGLATALRQPDALLLEVGPGSTLSAFARRHPAKTTAHTIVSSLRHPQDHQSDVAHVLSAAGQIWLAGGTIDWQKFSARERRQRVHLPTYPFERRRYWLMAEPQPSAAVQSAPVAIAVPVIEDRPALPDEQAAHGAAAPRDELEQTIARLWQRVLGIAHVRIHDHFFELGGDSLLAVQLITLLRDATQVELPAHSLLQAPTIAALAERVRQAAPSVSHQSGPVIEPTRQAQLVEIQPGGAKRPLFCVHPVGGGVYIYRDLARLLGTERPIYGIQAQGFDGHAEPLTSIPEMAAQYVKLIRARQATGPYLLVGASFGGIVSFEIAQQLRAQEQSVALLALIDTPDLDQTLGDGQLTDDECILASVLGIGSNLAVFLAELRQLTPEAQLRYCFARAKASQSLPLGLELPAFRDYIQLITAHFAAMRSYQPRAYPASILYFRAAERDLLNPPHPERCWIDLATSGLTIYTIPGTHLSMNYPPNVQVLAATLKRYLDRIDTEMV